ncbi:MAG: kelch repeat-containing protein [Candidatus Promineifilaceae bacterium]
MKTAISLLLILLLTACDAAATTPTPSPTVVTPIAAAPSPTATIQSTATPTPLPHPTPFLRVAPPPCSGHDMVYHTQLALVVLANCLDARLDEPEMSSLWGWDGSEWYSVSNDGPPPRLLGGVAYDSQSNLFLLFGGRALTVDYTDFWTWDPIHHWQQLDTPAPGGLSNHLAMVYDPVRERVVLYGGQDLSQQTYTNTWEWDGAEWLRRALTGPSLNIHYALTFDPVHQQVLLLGEGPNQLWGWNGQSWQRHITGVSPPTRAGARMAYDAAANQLVLFGGRDYGRRQILRDTWLWDGVNWAEWTGDGPPPRSHHSMVYDEGRGRVVLYGGIDPQNNEYNDTWEWDGQTWVCVHNC